MARARILIVEDDELVARELGLRLESMGHAVAGILTRGEDVLLHAPVLKTDLILMDIVLDGAMDGIETARQLQRRYDVPVVFLTGHDDVALARRAMTTAPFAYLQKPIKDRELQLTLELALYRHGMETRLKNAHAQLEQRYAALAESELRFRTLFEASPIGIVFAEPDGRFIKPNQAFCDMLAYSEEELCERDFLSVTHPDDLTANRELAGKALGGEISGYRMEKRYVRKDGEIVWGSLVTALIRDQAGQPSYWLAMVENITQRKELEALRQLRQTERCNAMIRNLHHRIEHSLDDVTDLLLRHMAVHPQTWEVIEEAIGQFNAIAIVHALEGRAQGRDILLEEMVAAILRSVKDARAPQLGTSLVAKVRVTDHEAVPVALILKVLILNAVRHGSGPSRIELGGAGGGVSVLIANPSPGGLPAGLDFAAGAGLGVGLSLVKALLPPEGADFLLHQQGSEVRAELTLFPPVVSAA